MTDPKKPSSSTSTSSSLFAWLGRQVGYVSGAIRKPPKKQPVVAHREASVQEASPPDQPHVTLRRTVIDEVLIDPEKK